MKESGQLIDEQYADRQALRPILDVLTEGALSLGEVSVQARKTYVTFCTPRRAFALVLPVTRSRIDLGRGLPDVPLTERMRAVPRGVGQGSFARHLARVHEGDRFIGQEGAATGVPGKRLTAAAVRPCAG